MSPSLVFRSKCHRSTFCLYRIWQLTFITSYLGNLTVPKVQTILFLNTSVRRTICCHFHENRCYFIFSTLYNLYIYLWPLKPHNFKSMCRISKIITFLESLRQAGWFDLFESDIQALLIFDPLITLWGNFDAPYLKLLNDASVASACFYVRTCRRNRNSKKIATIRDFHLPGSLICLSTRLERHQDVFKWRKLKWVAEIEEWVSNTFRVSELLLTPVASGGTRIFLGHRGGKMSFWRGKYPKIYQKWLILIFSFWRGWGQVGEEPPTGGGGNAPCPSWCRHCLT